MEKIGVFDAKTHFSEIAKRVKETGRAIRVTNRGEEMVDIAPITARSTGRRSRKQVFLELSRLRRELPKTNLAQIKTDIAEGRR